MSYENYDPYFPDQPVVDLYLPIWANLPSFRSKPAFIWAENGSNNVTQGSTLTYAQLHHTVQCISSQLLFPLQRDPSFAKENYHHLVRVLKQTKPKAAIAHRDYIKSVRRYVSSNSKDKQLAEMLQNLRWISTDDLKDEKEVSKWPLMSYNGCKPNEMYLIQYTSGATGIPKPVLVTAGAAAHNVRTARKAYDLHPNSVIVSWLPQYHDCGLMFLLLTIVSGATCVLTSPGAFVNRPRLWLELITEFKATCTPVPSFTLPLVVKRGGVDKGTLPINLWSLKNLIIINEPIYRESVEEFVNKFTPFGLNPSSISPSYGLAENCTFVSTAWRSNVTFPNIPSHNKLLPSARLAFECRDDEDDINIIVVNEETHEPVDDGIEGEIWVSSPSNASGYLGHPSLTREAFHSQLSNKLSRGFVRTGDRGIVKGEERYLFVTGRSSDILKLQNCQEIHPHYIETAAYNSSPKFLRGGCLAAFDISRTIVVVAEVQRSEAEIEVLRRICEGIKEAVMKEVKVEVGLVVLVESGSVPKTTSGKIQRWAARDKLMGGKMNVVMDMNHGSFSSPLGTMVHASKGKGGRKGDEGRRVIVEEEMGLSFSGAPARPCLRSFL
ncbi:hypothetical protein L1049_026003 [Liquidambar formosana]|uniref:AMP-dependent synthetase/ligase domain-containing protein n=1 Tax=Liquidambar formosana TaxID=63359 RepID=A0AAP0NG47_LIQFO